MRQTNGSKAPARGSREQAGAEVRSVYIDPADSDAMLQRELLNALTEKGVTIAASAARARLSVKARIQIAIQCKQDVNCYGNTLKLKPDDAARANAGHIRDMKDWTADDKLGLLEGTVERAMLEVGKRGQKASGLTDALLDSAKNDNRIIRQSVLLALPKIAKVPCSNCEAKLQEAIRAGEGKTTLGNLNLETTMMKNYFGWAGGKTPSAPAEKDDPHAIQENSQS